MIVAILAAGGYAGYSLYREIQPRRLRICALTDAGFRLMPGSDYRVRLWLAEVNRVFAPAKVQWELIATGDAYPESTEGDLAERRLRMEQNAVGKADVIVGFSGRSEPDFRFSATPFGHSILVGINGNDSDALAVTELARAMAVLFGFPSSARGIELADAGEGILNQRALELARRMRYYDFSRGIAALKGSWERQAIDAVTEAQRGKQSDGVAEAHRIVARALAANNLHERAVGHFRSATARSPGDANLRLECAVELLAVSDPEGALEELRKAASVDPMDARSHAAMGGIQLNSKRIEEAIEELRIATKLEPANPEYQIAFGRAASAQMGRSTEAAAAFQAVLRVRPNDPIALSGLRVVEAMEASAERAIPVIEGELRSNPNSSDAHMRLGIAYAAVAKMEAAKRELERSIELNPGNGDAHLAMSRWFYLREDYSAAERELVKAIAAGKQPSRAYGQAIENKLRAK